MTEIILQRAQESKIQNVENLDFLEEETKMLKESYDESERNLSVCQEKLEYVKAAWQDKESQCTRFERMVVELRSKLENTQEELDETKTKAHFMLLKQGAELTNISVVVAEIKSCVIAFINELQEKAKTLGADSNGDNAANSSDEAEAKAENRKSFVSALLLAAANADGPESPDKNTSLQNGSANNICDMEQFESINNPTELFDQSANTLDPLARRDNKGLSIGSANSAFTCVTSRKEKVNKDAVNDNHKLNESLEDDKSILEELQRISSSVDILRSAVQACEIARVNEITELSYKVESQIRETSLLGHHIENEKVSSAEEINDLEMQLSRANKTINEKTLRIEELELNVAELNSKIVVYEDQLNKVIDQQNLVQRLMAEKTEALKEVDLVIAEREAVEKEMKDTVRQLKLKNEGRSDSEVIMEKVQVKKELARLKEKCAVMEEDHKKVIEVANKRMNLFHENWKKAEKEIEKLDEFLSYIRQTCNKYKSILEQQNELKQLLLELGGVSDNENGIESEA